MKTLIIFVKTSYFNGIILTFIFMYQKQPKNKLLMLIALFVISCIGLICCKETDQQSQKMSETTPAQRVAVNSTKGSNNHAKTPKMTIETMFKQTIPCYDTSELDSAFSISTSVSIIDKMRGSIIYESNNSSDLTELKDALILVNDGNCFSIICGKSKYILLKRDNNVVIEIGIGSEDAIRFGTSLSDTRIASKNQFKAWFRRRNINLGNFCREGAGL